MTFHIPHSDLVGKLDRVKSKCVVECSKGVSQKRRGENESEKVYCFTVLPHTIQIPLGVLQDIYPTFHRSTYQPAYESFLAWCSCVSGLHRHVYLPPELRRHILWFVLRGVCKDSFSSLGYVDKFIPLPPLRDEGNFRGRLRQDQLRIMGKCLDSLRQYQTCFLELPTATGKTCLATYLTCRLGMRTVFLCHLDTVNKQTLSEYQKFTDLSVELVKKKRLNLNCRVHILGLRKAYNIFKERPDEFQDVGFVIVDEAHLCTRFTFSELMFCFCPKFLLGMSATPDKIFFERCGVPGRFFQMDQYQKTFLDAYFPHRIQMTTTKTFQVTKISTPFVPDTSKKIWFGGKRRTDWVNAMTSLAMSPQRNDFIMDLVQKHSEHKILVMCGRVAQCEHLATQLAARGEHVDVLVGKKKSYDTNARVLIGGVKKIGVGFNDMTLTMLILCWDMTDVRQAEGRIRVVDNVILDLVDNNKSLQDHWKMRKQWYLDRGAEVFDTTTRKKGNSKTYREKMEPPSFLFSPGSK
jgi:hypothetical protein